MRISDWSSDVCSSDLLFARTEALFDERAPDTKLSEPRALFWGTLWQFWPIYSHVLLSSILINCFAIASPLFITTVYDRVVSNQAVANLRMLAGTVISVLGFELSIRTLRPYFVNMPSKHADVNPSLTILDPLTAHPNAP